jgi:tRNA A-37 threonylcarbamoyl transferase component Bud32
MTTIRVQAPAEQPSAGTTPTLTAGPQPADTASGVLDQPAAPTAPFPQLPPALANHPRYQILRVLGKGSMSVVYEARQTAMDRHVAIKAISKALLDEPGAQERFFREVMAAAQLSHPNIVAAYETEQAGDLQMLVMEFVPGQSLAEVLRRKGPLPVTHACHYVRQVALGLEYAFERGLVHRDIKPHNLMLTPRGDVKILDFGLAKLMSEIQPGTGLTALHPYMGTPEYSAPEQATDARSADIRADIYSLGCTLYYLLAGRPPFHEQTLILTILAQQQSAPRPLPELREDVPPALWRVVACMLAKDPAQRYQTPAEVVQALEPFCRDEPGGGTEAAPLAPAVADESRQRFILREDVILREHGHRDQAPGRPVAPGQVPAGVEQAQRAFRRDLPELLRKQPGLWVAYAGNRQLGFAPTKTELYQKCLAQGLDRSEFIVRCIEPESDELTL